MQIIADADERKSLLEELAYAARAEQEQTQNDAVLLRRSDQRLSRRAQFGRRIHMRELIRLVKAHRHTQVVLAKEQDVYARDRGDLGDVYDARCGLDLQSDDDVLVRLSHVSE